MMGIEEFLGKQAAVLVDSLPFKNWPVEKSIEDGLDERIIQYVFRGRGLALRCDSEDRISVIFMRSEGLEDYDGPFFEIPFSLDRSQVIEHFGPPAKSGGEVHDPVLGDYGAWDRFSRAEYAIHVEYRVDRDAIKRITLMRRDVVPV